MGERERKRAIERGRGVDIDPAMLLEPTGTREVARRRCVARERELQRSSLQRREEEGGADRRAPLVSDGGEAVRSDVGAGGALNPTAELRSNGPN